MPGGYTGYVSRAMGDYYRRLNWHPSGLEMVLGGLASGLGQGYQAYLQGKRQTQEDARRAALDAQNSQYMQAQMGQMQQSAQLAQEKQRLDEIDAIRNAYLTSAPIDDQGQVDTSSLPSFIKSHGFDPGEPRWQNLVYTPQEGAMTLMARKRAAAALQSEEGLAGQRGQPKAPQTRQIHKNGLVVDQEWDPKTQTWSTVGQGPQFNPRTGKERPTFSPDRRAMWDPESGSWVPTNGLPEPSSKPPAISPLSLYNNNYRNPLTGVLVPGAPPFGEWFGGGKGRGYVAAMGASSGPEKPAPSQPTAPPVKTMAPQAGQPRIRIVRTATGPNGQKLGLGEDGNHYILTP